MRFNLVAIFTVFWVLVVFFVFTGCSKKDNGLPAKRVILIGIDGVGGKDLQKAKTPNLDSLIHRGALSLKTRGVMPTVSGPNWGSHLLGAGPEQHGITDNGWTVNSHSVEPTAEDTDGYFPSVFKIIKDQMPGANTAMFYDWDALANYYNPAFIDKLELSNNFEQTFEKARPWIIENEPEFTFIYIGEPDEMGHEYQWHSKEYIESIEHVDEALGEFFIALKENGLFEETHFIVVTDHGGVGYGHGGLSMDEIEIPWIISGPGIIKNRIIEQANNVFNTASTIAYLFHLEQPQEWIGSPVYGAFVKEKEFSKTNINSYLPQPFFSIESGLYPEPQIVELVVSDPSCEVRFEINGTLPNHKSRLYEGPVYLQKSKKMRAVSFNNGNQSVLSELDFRLVVEIQDIKLKNPPAEKYAGDGSTTLSNFKLASNDYKDNGWLGFQGVDLEVEISLDKIKDIDKIFLGCLNNPGSWIFLPNQIQVLASVDGIRYIQIGHLNGKDIQASSMSGRNEIMIPINSVKVKFLKVIAQNVGVCPKGHSGEGEKAWLFVDEIILENN